jgi:hypothetical protein
MDSLAGLTPRFQAIFRYDVQRNKFTYDSTVLPPNVSKSQTFGFFVRRTFFFKCDGKGGFEIKEISTIENKLRNLSKLKDNGLITDEDFEEQKRKLLQEF